MEMKISTIQALLLAVTFPHPVARTSKDQTYTLSGLALNLALQLGLHVPRKSQDYSLLRAEVDQDEVIRRAELWLYCIATHQK